MRFDVTSSARRVFWKWSPINQNGYIKLSLGNDISSLRLAFRRSDGCVRAFRSPAKQQYSANKSCHCYYANYRENLFHGLSPHENYTCDLWEERQRTAGLALRPPLFLDFVSDVE
jgi:hypothetical protein